MAGASTSSVICTMPKLTVVEGVGVMEGVMDEVGVMEGVGVGEAVRVGGAVSAWVTVGGPEGGPGRVAA